MTDAAMPLTTSLRLDGLVIDLDGVVWLGRTPIAGSVAAINAFRMRALPLLFLTNDPRSSRREIASELAAVGIQASERQIVTAGSALATLMRECEPLAQTAFVIGSPSLQAEVADAGFALLSPEDAGAAHVVAVGGHDGFDYRELRAAAQALHGGAVLYGAGRDATFPMPDGPWPATGAVLAAVEVAGGVTATVVGKPEPYIFALARDLLPGQRVAIVGDHLEADIGGGHRAGLTTILVLTGTASASEADSSPIRPDYVLPDLAALATLL
jgi:glycerol 3-phosphatase-2